MNGILDQDNIVKLILVFEGTITEKNSLTPIIILNHHEARGILEITNVLIKGKDPSLTFFNLSLILVAFVLVLVRKQRT